MFTISEILEATGGRLISGRLDLTLQSVSIDSRTLKSGDLFIAIKGNRFNGHTFIPEAIAKGARAIIFSDPIFIQHPCLSGRQHPAFIKVKNTRIALADLGRFHRKRFDIPVIAITGSTGKTTLKEMLSFVLSSRLKVLKNEGTQNNEIGLPLTLLKLNNSFDIAVLELGTNHFGEIANLAKIAQPNLGIITNIGPAHLEFFGSLQGVYKEKLSLLNYLSPPMIAILNADEPRLRKLINNQAVFVVSFGIENRSDFSASKIRWISPDSWEFRVTGYRQSIRLSTLSYANIYHALAAISVARLFGLDYESIRRGLENFVFLPGRLKFINLKGLSFIDDTYNANPASLTEALDVLNRLKVKGRKILVMGDMLELGRRKEDFHRDSSRQIARICDALICVGKFSHLTAQEAVKRGLNKENVFICENSIQARKLLFANLRPTKEDLILVKGSRLMKMEEVLK